MSQFKSQERCSRGNDTPKENRSVDDLGRKKAWDEGEECFWRTAFLKDLKK